MAVQFRRAQSSDLEEAVRLMNAMYARKKNVNYFLWQYFDPRARASLYCAFEASVLVGLFGLQVKLLSNGLCCGQAMDMLVHKDFRKQGIFSALATFVLQKFKHLDLFCVFPNLAGKMATERGLEWKTLLKIPNNVGNVGDFASSDRTNDDCDNVREAVGNAKAHTIAFQYDRRYSAWRFEAHPLYNYFASSNRQAVAVMKIFVDPVRQETVGDIVHLEGIEEPDRLHELLDRSIAALRSRGVHLITTWAINRPVVERELRHKGFRQAAQERYFCLKVNRPDLEYLYSPEVWSLEQADTEVF